jgi:hypothetical protein
MRRDIRRWLLGTLCGASFSTMVTLGAVPVVLAQDAEDAMPLEAAAESPAEGLPLTINGSLLAKEPETAAEHLEAVLLMLDLGRTDLAKAYLAKLVELAPDDAALLELRDQFGPAAFARLARLKELRPVGAELADRIAAASIQSLSDPARLAKLIGDLNGDAEARATAFESLRNAGAVAVPGVLAALENAQLAAVHQSLLQILVEMGDVAVPPLVGALESPSSRMRSQAMTALGYLRAESALPFLSYPAVGDDVPTGERAVAVVALGRIQGLSPTVARDRIAVGAVERLLTDARGYLDGRKTLPVDEVDELVVWGWDDANGGLIRLSLTQGEAADRYASRLAKQALSLSPERLDAQTIYLTTLLVRHAADSKATGALPKGALSATDIGLTVGPRMLLRSLDLSLSARRGEAAVAALRLLEKTASAADLSEDSPILAALNASDERVQFAAARTILQIDPREQFSGSSRVVEILVRALAGENERKAVIVHPSGNRGTQLAGQLAELGFNPLLFTTGKSAFKAAADRNDVSVVVVHANSIRWAASETVANLRADSRTAGIPILLVGSGETQPAMVRLAAMYRDIGTVNEAQTSADIELQGQEFFRGLNTQAMSETERFEQRNEAMEWLRHLALTNRTRVFPIQRAEKNLLPLISEPDLLDVVVQLLGEIPSEASQRAIATVMLEPTREPGQREAAALKLAFHIQQFGLLLTADQAAAIELAWAEEQDAELRTAFATVVGSLKPDRVLAGKRLRTAK